MHRIVRLPFILAAAAMTACLFSKPLAAQQAQQPFEPIGHTAATALDVSGAVNLAHGEMQLGNGSTVTASTQAVNIDLRRGGEVRLCPTTSLHLAKDRSIHDPASTALMMALDRGALEARYKVGKYSDVLLTPDLRILISGPGEADFSIRVNAKGDTCVDNHGAKAPYVTVSNQIEGGAYRVMPNQRVIFEHGSLSEVVDRAMEPCGCPETPPVEVAIQRTHDEKAGQPLGGPSSTPEDTTFPLAVSEGLAAPPTPTKPVTPVGQVHAQVSVPLVFSGEHPPALPPAKAPQVAEAAPTAAGPETIPVTDSATIEAEKPHRGFLGSIGHFFSRIFGR